MEQTALYGLIGKELTHSFSPNYFKKKFLAQSIRAEYRSFPIPDISELKPLLEVNTSLLGLNVTIPYKQSVLPLLDHISETAKAIGAVNCIQISNGELHGHNTDVIGFKKSLQPLLSDHIKQALILGNGGATKAVAYVLNELGIEHQIVSRTKTNDTITYNTINEDVLAEHQLIINTTPLGMHPNEDAFPILPYRFLNNKHVLYDLIYNPAETKFLKYGNHYGATTKNGLEMLELQAEASWSIWQGS